MKWQQDRFTPHRSATDSHKIEGWHLLERHSRAGWGGREDRPVGRHTCILSLLVTNRVTGAVYLIRSATQSQVQQMVEFRRNAILSRKSLPPWGIIPIGPISPMRPISPIEFRHTDEIDGTDGTNGTHGTYGNRRFATVGRLRIRLTLLRFNRGVRYTHEAPQL